MHNPLRQRAELSRGSDRQPSRAESSRGKSRYKSSQAEPSRAVATLIPPKVGRRRKNTLPIIRNTIQCGRLRVHRYTNYTRGAVHQSYLFGCRCRVYLMAIKAVTPWNFEGISSGSHCCRTPPPRHTNQLHRCHKNTIPSQTRRSRHLPRDRSVFSP